jgi:hypothetical protein
VHRSVPDYCAGAKYPVRNAGISGGSPAFYKRFAGIRGNENPSGIPPNCRKLLHRWPGWSLLLPQVCRAGHQVVCGMTAESIAHELDVLRFRIQREIRPDEVDYSGCPIRAESLADFGPFHEKPTFGQLDGRR